MKLVKIVLVGYENKFCGIVFFCVYVCVYMCDFMCLFDIKVNGLFFDSYKFINILGVVFWGFF